ncbi:MAG: HD domain-containing protein, partial [Gemmatimonadetes bacterium]|nr:HD domain-containing protein [Gemmatimonadota bacterium]
MSPKRRAHIERVASLAASWADAMKVAGEERERWLRAAFLHDALRDAPQSILEQFASDRWRASALMHGPAAAECAARHGERDRGVLDAVSFHSVGYAGWERVGHILYLADFLDPGRDFKEAERRAMADRVPRNVAGVLREVAAERLHWV